MKRREISLIYIHGKLDLAFVMGVVTRIIRGIPRGKTLYVCARSASILLLFFWFSFRDHVLPFSIFYVVVNLYTTNWLVNSGRDHHVVRIVRL